MKLLDVVPDAPAAALPLPDGLYFLLLLLVLAAILAEGTYERGKDK